MTSSFAKEQLRKVFIGGLSLKTTEESLKEYFSKWGNLIDVVVMRFPDTKRSRGFGFVTYEDVDAVDAVLDAKPHVLDGKDIEPKRAIAREDTSRLATSEVEKSKKVFVGGLASSTTEEDVRDCFEDFCKEAGKGGVVEVMLLKDKDNNNRLRGFCFVVFDCDEIVDKVCSVKYFEIRTKTVEVRRAESRQEMRRREDKTPGHKRRHEDPYPKRDMENNMGSNNSNMFGGSGGGGMNPFAMQAAFNGGGGGMPFSAGFGGNRSGSGGFGGGFGMNPFSGMMNAGITPNMLTMLANAMSAGMASGGMGGSGGGMGNSGGGMGNDSFRKDRSNVGSNSSKSGVYSGETIANTNSNEGSFGNQSGSGFDQANAMSEMQNFANMWGSGGNAAANMQAAMFAAGYTGGMDGSGDMNQLGSYNQTSSLYGPSRGSQTKASPDSARRGYKPY